MKMLKQEFVSVRNKESYRNLNKNKTVLNENASAVKLSENGSIKNKRAFVNWIKYADEIYNLTHDSFWWLLSIYSTLKTYLMASCSHVYCLSVKNQRFNENKDIK
jgi:hypothetical protein